MKVLKFKGKISLKGKLLIALAALLLATIISIMIVYAVNESARDWININVLGKEVTEEDVATIDIDSSKNNFIFAFDKYIGILCNGKLSLYNSYGNKSYELEVTISNPVIETNGSYLAIAEKGGQRAYLIVDRKNTMGK